MRDTVSSIPRRLLALVILAVAAWILLKVIIGIVAGLATAIAVIAALVAVVWAVRTFRSF